VATINPRGAMRPASTQKLFTTLPHLLDRPDRRLVTDVAVTARPVAGVLRGNLVVHASADPSLLKRHLNQLADQVRRAGIRRVTGHLVLDIGDLPRHTRQRGWKSSFIPWDVGPLSPFPVWEDVWRHDSRYISHPTKSNLALFRDRLAQAGVKVLDSNRIVRDSVSTDVVAVHRSAPMRELVKHTLRISDNFYAESLLAIGGGHRRVKQLTSAAGVSDVSYATDGSGLSYDDRQSPRGEVQLLNYATTTPAYDELRAAMPRACRSGTLRHRFCHTIGAGKVRAKTGTLTHSTALAGYTTDARGRRVTFSVITAGVRSITAAVKATDRAVLVLRRYAG
jgi:D-alanyl-D-alanine carboxypeptidase/D-alanyl-D-alanine-endopeptidase (penicillin-binding protein 4)